MTGPTRHLPPEDEADLAALADGALYGPRRAALETRLAREPELAAAYDRQCAVVRRLATSAPRAPLSLRLLIEELEPVVVRRRRRLLPAVALAFAATLAAFVVLLAARGPAVEEVLAVAGRPAVAPASLGQPFEGVRFPSYGEWRATGERTDVVAGREVRTVFYERDGRQIAYAIVAGPALGDDELRRLRSGGVVAVTWTRRGRTCVIAASGVGADVLAGLAVW